MLVFPNGGWGALKQTKVSLFYVGNCSLILNGWVISGQISYMKEPGTVTTLKVGKQWLRKPKLLKPKVGRKYYLENYKQQKKYQS